MFCHERFTFHAASENQGGTNADAANQDDELGIEIVALSYDASAKVQRDDFDPQLIVLVRRGRVEGEPLVAKTAAPASAVSNPPVPSAPPQKNPQTNDSVMNRVRAFFHW